MITWDGITSDSLNCIVERYPVYTVPRRKQSAISVPGRNGDLLLQQQAYSNYIQAYDVYLSGPRNGSKMPEVAQAVAAWLNVDGYRKLVDDYTPGSYRMAFFQGPLELENIFNLFGRATVEFNCKPQRFLDSGDTAQTVSASGGKITNPTAYNAKPLITVYGSGAAILQVGEYVCTLAAIDGSITLDSDTENAYKGVTNLNSQVTIPEFPELVPGDNDITWTGGITSVEIIPRWWTL